MDHNYSNLPDDLRDAQSCKWRSFSTSCPGLVRLQRLVPIEKLPEKTHTHTHTEQPDQDLLIDEALGVDWYRSDRKTQKFECLAKAECKGRGCLRWRGLGPWPRGPSASMPRGPVLVFATCKTCITARVDWRQCSHSGGFYWRRVG
jgi:hypothetical protein